MASSGDSSGDNQRNCECPVCLRIFRTPKILLCGHSVCAECVEKLKKYVFTVQCPICRASTNVVCGLPTNYALKGLIDEQKLEKTKKFKCDQCPSRHSLEDMWACNTCNLSMVCANCVIKNHRTDHELQSMSDLLEKRQVQLTDWHQRMELVYRDIAGMQTQLDTDLYRVHRRSFQFHSTLRTKVGPIFAKAIQAANVEGFELHKSITDLDVCDLTASGRYENHISEIPEKFQKLKETQEKIRADIRLVDEVVQNSHDVLHELLSRIQGSTQAVAAAAAVASGGRPASAAAAGEWSLLDLEDELAEIDTPPRCEQRQRSDSVIANDSDSIRTTDELMDDVSEDPNRLEQLNHVRVVLARHLPVRFAADVASIGQLDAPLEPIRLGGYGRGAPIYTANAQNSASTFGTTSRRGRGRGMSEPRDYLPSVGRLNSDNGNQDD